jgi:hypothetical protein
VAVVVQSVEAYFATNSSMALQSSLLQPNVALKQLLDDYVVV